RLGDAPRQCVTSTPRPVALLRRLLDDPFSVVTHATTRDNVANLSPAFLDAVVKRYAGTRLGRQELDGELIADRADALWRRDALEGARWTGALPALRRVVVAVDPPASSSKTADACGIVSAGIDGDGRFFVLDDKSLSGATPAAWAGRAVSLYRRREADAIVAEVNQGGDMVAAVLRQVDETVPVHTVRASRGKWLRAEPIAALYEQGRVYHARTLAALEDEMCDFGPDGLSGGRSPDRLDALVWALTALAGGRAASPRIRGLAGD
ncbi:MAG: DNA-packaging protein, partial [Caulobacterales bacterium]|nr:DNA-packaging protein [Caulobacterales bacterium]